MAAPAVVCSQAQERRRAFELLKESLVKKPSTLPIEALLPTAIPQLDRLLGGGFPAGIIVTLEGETGCWSLGARLAAHFSRRGLVAILDDGGLYPPALAEAGVILERLMIVPARKALATARAADILLRSRICRLVLMPAVAFRDAIWKRLAKLAHRSGAVVIVITQRAGAALSTVAGVRLRCTFERELMLGGHGLWGLVGGFELCVGLCKHKHMAAGASTRLEVVSA